MKKFIVVICTLAFTSGAFADDHDTFAAEEGEEMSQMAEETQPAKPEAKKTAKKVIKKAKKPAKKGS